MSNDLASWVYFAFLGGNELLTPVTGSIRPQHRPEGRGRGKITCR